MKALLRSVLTFGVVMVLLAAGQFVPAFVDPEGLLYQQQELLLGMAIGCIALGFVLFIGGAVLVATQPQRTRQQALEQGASVRRLHEDRWGRYLLRYGGAGWRRRDNNEYTLRELKQALRTGAWRNKPELRRFLLMLAGWLLLLCGMFSLGVVLGPPGIKLLCAAVLLYVLLRTGWAFWRA